MRDYNSFIIYSLIYTSQCQRGLTTCIITSDPGKNDSRASNCLIAESRRLYIQDS